MKKLSYLFCFIFLCSCTSNTIFEEPKDLIPRDTMSLLIQELMIASSSKYVKNKDLRTKINYVPLVYTKFKIDSLRFQSSNFYYATKIDIYKEIIENAKNTLDKKVKTLTKLKRKKDSIKKDSLDNANLSEKEKDSIKKLKIPRIEKDSLGITPELQ